MARLSANKDEQQVRLGFQLFASDNPLLVAELLKLPKGKLRHARLVTLATIGLLTERRVITGARPPMPAVGHPATGEVGDDARQILPLTDNEYVDVDWDQRAGGDAGLG
jgi:hypothetical protein